MLTARPVVNWAFVTCVLAAPLAISLAVQSEFGQMLAFSAMLFALYLLGLLRDAPIEDRWSLGVTLVQSFFLLMAHVLLWQTGKHDSFDSLWGTFYVAPFIIVGLVLGGLWRWRALPAGSVPELRHMALTAGFFLGALALITVVWTTLSERSAPDIFIHLWIAFAVMVAGPIAAYPEPVRLRYPGITSLLPIAATALLVGSVVTDPGEPVWPAYVGMFAAFAPFWWFEQRAVKRRGAEQPQGRDTP